MNANVRKLAALAAAVVILAAGFALLPPLLEQRTLKPDASVVLPDKTAYDVRIADTPAARSQGLGGLASLKPNQGMLFVFPDAERPIFWMKDMRFPIDIIWLSKGVVVDEELDAPVPPIPSQPEARYLPEADADMVLEVSAGTFVAHHLANGDRLDVRLPAGYTRPAN